MMASVTLRLRVRQRPRRVRVDLIQGNFLAARSSGAFSTPKGGSGKQILLSVDRGKLRMRWMSPREYARLQGAPDFPLDLPRNQLLYGFADAVCVPAITWLDDHVLTPIYDAWASRSETYTSPVRWRNGKVAGKVAGFGRGLSLSILPPESPRPASQRRVKR